MNTLIPLIKSQMNLWIHQLSTPFKPNDISAVFVVLKKRIHVLKMSQAFVQAADCKNCKCNVHARRPVLCTQSIHEYYVDCLHVTEQHIRTKWKEFIERTNNSFPVNIAQSQFAHMQMPKPFCCTRLLRRFMSGEQHYYYYYAHFFKYTRARTQSGPRRPLIEAVSKSALFPSLPPSRTQIRARTAASAVERVTI